MVATKRRRRLGSALATVALLTVLGVGTAFFASRNEPSAPYALRPQDPGPIHVHGLGRNPSDGALFIATHTGVWRLPTGAARAVRVSASLQDTMGFTVVGPDRFLGSGHPDLRQARERGVPPHLGLIQSVDAGRSWTPVSLLGRADFHVLRASRRHLYGLDSLNGRLLVSRDLGATWGRRKVPAPVYDLAPHPRRAGIVLASTERGIHRSTDAGKTWTRLGDGVGLLSWPQSDRLYLVDQGGQVFESPDAGSRWRRSGTLPGQPTAFLAAGPREIYAALHDGTITHSLDRGASWLVRARP